jgi:hypothetical protein
MDRTNTAKPHTLAGTTRGEPSNTKLGLLLRKLDSLDAPRPPLRDDHACRAARVQAVQWFNRLDTSDQPNELDKLWPRFEKWLARRPENLEMYLAVERTCWTLEEFRRWSAPEGPEGAQELQQWVREELQSLCVRAVAATRRVAIATLLVMNFVALYLIAR